jgi:hypothetical protein
MGPILEEFSKNRSALIAETYELFRKALESKGRPCPEAPPSTKITAQGGVGTAEEHQFLLEFYHLDSIGWGSPFLLVPEVVNIDEDTLQLLCDAKEEDLYLSNISPLGVPFNTVRGNSKDIEKDLRIETGDPGSKCSKRFASLNSEFTEKPICTASRQYQRLKIAELNEQEMTFNEYIGKFKAITDKACICVGLGTSALLTNNLDTQSEGPGVSVCPGPNLAWFTEVATLKQMTDHIYGRESLIKRTGRPHMFINELKLYIDYLEDLMSVQTSLKDQKQKEYFSVYSQNLLKGIAYYYEISSMIGGEGSMESLEFRDGIAELENRLHSLHKEVLVESFVQ